MLGILLGCTHFSIDNGGESRRLEYLMSRNGAGCAGGAKAQRVKNENEKVSLLRCGGDAEISRALHDRADKGGGC